MDSLHSRIGDRRQPDRRGVLLLVVLSMLTLFMLLGITFLILASRARTTARAFLRLSENTTRSTESFVGLTREAALQVLRGGSTGSVLRGHDLLGDRYGTPVGRFSIAAAMPTGNGQLLRLDLSEAAPANYSGLVLTFAGGPAAAVNFSTRVITSVSETGDDTNTLYVLRPAGLEDADVARLVRAEVVLNGRDYAGGGYAPGDAASPNWANLPAAFPRGMPNEDYDAADLDNLMLPGEEGVSFHRPALIEEALNGAPAGWPTTGQPENYGGGSTAILLAEVAQLRRASLRPFAFDHSPDGQVDFTGRSLVNPKSALCVDAASGFGDVDSDGDGVIDSVWIDLGMTPVLLADRALVKPLFAIKCIELGGRLNLNVHGSPTHLAESPDVEAAEGEKTGDSYPSLRPGLGFGPLDVRLDPVIGKDGLARAVYDIGRGLDPTITMMNDAAARKPWNATGRYGMAAVGGFPTALNSAPRPRQNEVEEADRLYSGGPPDFWSRTGVAVDHWGRPLYLPMSGTAGLPEADSPYGLDLTRTRDSDSRMATTIAQPFTVGELEALLRLYDPDNTAVLPQRLVALNLARNSKEIETSLRETCTTESWDTPALIGELPSFLGPSSRRRFDPDLVRGLKMDLNRPFGDSLDNDNDGLVDEPDEPGNFSLLDQAQVMFRLLRGVLPIPEGTAEDAIPAAVKAIRNQPGPEEPGLRARQLFAYQIFNLLVSLPDAVTLKLAAGSWSADSTPVFTPREVGLDVGRHSRKVLAQWSVNVVDFMDSDAIMTPFRYDVGLGDVVLGCEAPELLITETLAIHDRGIGDGDTAGKIGTGPDDDNDWDQIRRPRGSLFVELYAVRGSGGPAGPPAELYSDGRLDLGRRPPDTGDGQPLEPVWRLALTGLRKQPTTPAEVNDWANKDVFAKLAKHPDSEWLAPAGSDGDVSGIPLARFAWFTQQGPVPDPERELAPTPENTYRLADSSDGPTSPQLAPGEVLVVGPRAETPLGDDGSAAGRPSSQVIELSFGNGDRPLVRTTTFKKGDDEVARTNSPREIPLVKAETKACILALPIPGRGNDASGLNVSEPLPPNYYPDKDGFYEPPKDDLYVESHDLLAQGTYVNAATVFLQRLADPTRAHDPRQTLTEGNNSIQADNPAWNPYVTVDFQPIDLHVLNGSSIYPEEIIEGTSRKIPNPDKPYHFHTRQRGLTTDSSGKPLGSGLSATKPYLNSEFTFTPSQPPRPAITANPWLSGIPELVNNPPGPAQSGQMIERARTDAQSNLFPYLLNFGGDQPPGKVPYHTLGFTNVSFGGRRFDGSPTTPFPWLVWNDRPFASEYELLLVPRTPAGRLLTNYRNPSKDPVGTLPPTATADFDAFGAFARAGHLMPFTAINDPPVIDPASPLPRRPNADVLSNLFGYVRVASPFAGTAHLLTEVPDPYFDNNADLVAGRFLPPFNALTTFREPGRVNINTIPRDDRGKGIWSGLLGLPSPDSTSGAGPVWMSQGKPTDTNSVEDIWKQAETQGGAAILRHRTTPVSVVNPDGSLGTRPARAASLLGDAAASSATPPPGGVGTPSPWLFGPLAEAPLPENGSQYSYAERNAWYAYQPLIRALANTTARSEVYAIWITMGFFEVERTPEDYVGTLPNGMTFKFYPDRYKLLREYGVQKGDVRRHRAFYLVDRSIPVGYEPGTDNNVSNTILVESLVD